jgi:hypothetical protein
LAGLVVVTGGIAFTAVIFVPLAQGGICIVNILLDRSTIRRKAKKRFSVIISFR